MAQNLLNQSIKYQDNIRPYIYPSDWERLHSIYELNLKMDPSFQHIFSSRKKGIIWEIYFLLP